LIEARYPRFDALSRSLEEMALPSRRDRRRFAVEQNPSGTRKGKSSWTYQMRRAALAVARTFRLREPSIGAMETTPFSICIIY